ncbi:MAG: hypothetical protein JWO36_1021 [Myxococcales bacterium]|nr:hypothetical protein [Myxococcales bacterium]
MEVARRVLVWARMSRRMFVAAVIAVAASGSAAVAGPYVGLGIGNSSVSDSTNNYLPDGRSGRLMLGTRFGNISAEGAFTGYGLIQRNGANGGLVDARSLSGALKLSIPLGNNFEGFARGGLIRTWLSPQSDARMPTYSGDGYTFSAGFEYRLNLIVAGTSLFVDYTHNSANLTADKFKSIDQTTSLWTLGLTVSI